MGKELNKMQKKLLLIVNPKAGMQKAEKYLLEILTIFHRYHYLPTVMITEKSGDATQFARQYCEEYDLLVCIGGDGTFNEMIEGVM